MYKKSAILLFFLYYLSILCMRNINFRNTNIVFSVVTLIGIFGFLKNFVGIAILPLILSVYLIILIAGSYFIRLNFYLKSLNKLPQISIEFSHGTTKVSEKSKNVMLTFDDGPVNNTVSVLNILKKENIRAVFFLIGENVVSFPEAAKSIVADGHQIGNHSYYHKPSFHWQAAQKMAQEILQTQKVIKNVTGIETSLFRPPFGVTNPNLKKALSRTGMNSIGWSIRSYDTVAKDPDVLLNKIVSKLHPGAIILLHEKCEITLSILPQLIQAIKAQGYGFDTI